jgi:hypothetical protein
MEKSWVLWTCCYRGMKVNDRKSKHRQPDRSIQSTNQSHQQIQILELVGVQDVHGVVYQARGQERGGREDLGVVGLGDVGDREALVWGVVVYDWVRLGDAGMD